MQGNDHSLEPFQIGELGGGGKPGSVKSKQPRVRTNPQKTIRRLGHSQGRILRDAIVCEPVMDQVLGITLDGLGSMERRPNRDQERELGERGDPKLYPFSQSGGGS